MFIGTKQEKKELIKKVIPVYLKDEKWIDKIKLQYDNMEYNNIREALAEAIDLKYIENAEAVRTIRGGINFQRMNNNQPILTQKGEKFLSNKNI